MDQVSAIGKRRDHVTENTEDTRQNTAVAPYSKVVSNKNSTIRNSIARTE